MTGLLPGLSPHVAEIARAILGRPNEQLSTRTQLRFGTNGSVAIEIAEEKRGEWFDHEAAGGGPWELLTIKGRMTKADAIGWLRWRLRIGLPRKALAILSRPMIIATSAATFCSRSADSSQRPFDSDGQTTMAAGHGTSGSSAGALSPA